MLPVAVGALLLAALGPAARAAQPGPRQPYQLRVVLDVAPNRLLTDVFRDQVRRELRDGLQAAFGDLALVEVVDEHPLMPEVRRQGLGGREPFAWKAAPGEEEVKTHFVRIDYAAGRYEIQARQHDGLTGLWSPVVRTDRTPDRAFVARAAALLVERDFGPVGEFAAWPRGDGQPQEVKLRLYGAGLGVPLGRWVKEGDVFAVASVLASGATQRFEFALAQVKEPPAGDDATCTARLFWRYKLSGDPPGGYRCLMLGTTRAPVRLRFVQSRPGGGTRPAGRLALQVRRHGFQGEEQGLIDGTTDAVGAYSTARMGEKGVFDRVAFVTVRSTAPVWLPLALVDDSELPVTVPAANDQGDLLTYRVSTWRIHVADSYRLYASVIKAVNDASEKGDLPKVVELGKAGLARVHEENARLTAEREELQRELKAPGAGPRAPDLSAEEARLKELQEREETLKGFVDKVEEESKKAGSKEAAEAKAQIESAKLAEGERAEYKVALDLLEKAKKVFPDDSKLAKHVEDLRAIWKGKGEKHVEAREFIYGVWPNLDVNGLAENMDKAKEAFKACRDVGDVYFPRRLLLANKKHAEDLKKQLDGLHPDLYEEDERLAKLIQKVIKDLKSLTEEIVAYLTKAEENKAAP
jgi:hypothetical protein